MKTISHNKPVALITGANQEIGLQVAKELAAHDYTVLVSSRNLERGEVAAGTINGDARPLQLDVTDKDSIAAAAKRIRRELGRLDLLINNAAISNTNWKPGTAIEDYAETTQPSRVSLDEMRAGLGDKRIRRFGCNAGVVAAHARNAGSQHCQRVEQGRFADNEFRSRLPFSFLLRSRLPCV
jgi:NAD(P)-dependent dehydrogenase (short-subunit alcohol dehydrogenase family)